MMYDKDTDKDTLSDVNTEWKQLDYVGYTPVIQTGISYMSKPFDLCYANLKPSNLTRDAMQMLMRCRVLNDNILYFSVNNRQTYNTNNINMFESFEDFNKDRGAKVGILIQDLITKQNSNQELISALANSLIADDPLLIKIMWYNLREKMLSYYHYNSMCYKLLQIQGYELITLNKNKNRKNENEDKEYIDEYNNITDIDFSEVMEIKNNPKLKAEDRLRIDRFYFEQMTVAELNMTDRAQLFYNFYQDSRNREKLYNIQCEKIQEHSRELIESDYHKSSGLVSKMKMSDPKLKHIKKFNKLIGLNNSCHNAHVVDKSIINSSVMAYAKEHNDELKTIFNSKAMIQHDNDIFNCFKLIEKIYGGWSGLKLAKHKVCNKKVVSYVTKSSDFYDSIKGIDEDMIMDESI